VWSSPDQKTHQKSLVSTEPNCPVVGYSNLLFFFGSGTGIWTQNLTLANHLSHTPSPCFAVAILWIGSHAFPQGQPWTLILLPMHHAYLGLQN
jgi:hypothetical protein